MESKISIDLLRQHFNMVMNNAPDYSMDNSDDQLFKLFCISVTRLFDYDQLDDECFKIRCYSESWIESD